MRSLRSIDRHRRSVSAIAFALACTFAIAGPVPAAHAAGGSRLWVATYKAADNTSAVAVSPDGARVFVTGESYGTTTSSDYNTVAYDAVTGAKIWARSYNGPGNGWDQPSALAVSLDGERVYVTGASGETPGYQADFDYATVAYDTATGATIWARRYAGYDDPNSMAGSPTGANAIGMSPDGATVYVTGQSWEGLPTGFGYVTVAYNAATGARVWVRRDIAGDARALAVSSDGTMVYVTGESYETNSDSKFATVAYDAASGAKIWLRRYLPTGWNDSTALALAVSPDSGRVFVTGYSSIYPTASDEYSAYTTAAYDSATGARVWARLYAGSGTADSIALGLAVSPDGGKVFVTGLSAGSSSDYDYATLAYDAAAGATTWVRRYNGPGNDYDQPTGVAVSPDGRRVYVTGRSVGAKQREAFATLSYDSVTGATVWMSRYHTGATSGSASALALSPDGTRLYVTGKTVRELGNGEESIDYTTISYATS